MGETAVYKELKKQIILLEKKPGAVLREKELMEAFGVSRTPVRESLMRLEMEGLVRIIPNVGTIVAEVSFQQLKDVFEVTSYLVGLVGELAALRINKEELAEIHRHIDAMKQTKEAKVLMQYDRTIHKIINSATKNEVLAKSLNTLHDQAVRIWAFSGNNNTYWDDLAGEHEEIASVLERRDGKRAAELLENHTRRFIENIRSQLTV